MKQLGQQNPQQLPTTMGPLDRVPCPHCQHQNTFVHLDSQQLLDTGHRMSCDGCKRMMEVTNIRVVKFVQVRPITGNVAATRSGVAVRQATTISHRQLNRMLGGR